MCVNSQQPLQSVANLIGRFERATKRSSLTNPPSPSASRANSVATHNTGDAAKIEAKERREWLPMANADTTPGPADVIPRPQFDTSDALRSVSPLLGSGHEEGALSHTPLDALSDPIVPQDVQVELRADASAESASALAAPSVMPKKSPTSAKPAARPAAGKTAPDTRTARTPARGTAAKPAAASPAPARSAPSKPPVTPMKPLKAQHTGTSMTSNTSTVRARSRMGAKSPPAGGVRAKTPTAAMRSSTSAGSASANASPARPKTPSGLYAPTKASLARAKNAPPLPQPVRKATIPASSLDRLSKPTAASASKARVSAVSPPRAPVAAAKPARGAAPTRGTLKPRVGLAPARMKAEREKKEKEAAASAAAVVAATGAAVAAAAGVEAEISETNGGTPEERVEDEPIEQPSFIADAVEEPEAQSSHSPVLSHGEPEPELGHESAVETVPGDDESSDIESYDDAYISENEGESAPLDTAHIQSAEAGEGSFSFTPEPAVRAATPIIAADVAAIAEVVDASVGADVIVDTDAAGHEEADQDEAIIGHENGATEEDEEKEAEIEVGVQEPLTPEESPASEVEDSLPNGSAAKSEPETATDELESLVNMLEAKVPERPASVSGSEASEAAGTIPDEE
ncbi:hypothetical protein M0805_007859 [Coniferiporia weirii]|nr:hypothetical protein M0805_007859 [Coniferiporia weirii]